MSAAASPAPKTRWTQPAGLRAKLEKRWQRGDFLREAADAAGLFPLRLPIRSPNASEMMQQFARVQDWVREWECEWERAPEAGLQLERRSVSHRQLGRNSLPAALIFPDVDTLARYLKRSRELDRFRRLLEKLRGSLPELLPWAAKRPFELLRCEPVLGQLIAAAGWVQQHPRPGIYLRQVPVAGIDTKFFEQHRGVLSQWLDILLPETAVDRRHSAGRGFARRYGFRTPPELVRFRILDPGCRAAAGGWSDISVPSPEFCRWFSRDSVPPFQQVFVTENDMNGLAFPELPASLVVFGRGYHFGALADAAWLQHCAIYYWGDIDTHGLAILSEFRSLFPHTESFLMDRDTLMSHAEHWGSEPTPLTGTPANLTDDEAALFADLAAGTIQPRLRLEQEYIAYPWLQQQLARLSSRSSLG